MLTGIMLTVLQGCTGNSDRTSLDARALEYAEHMQSAFYKGDLNAALALADSANAIDTDLPDVAFTRGLIYTRLKRFDDARSEYQKTLQLDANYRQAWYNLGHNAFLQREYRNALAYYNKERALIEAAQNNADTPDPQTHQDLAAITAQIGRTYALLSVQDSAQMALEEAIAIDSTYAVAHAWLSELYENQGLVDQALIHAQRALEGSPEEVEYAYQVGSLLFQNDRLDEAAMVLSAVVQRWPGHEGAAYNLGRTLMALGREDEGQAMLNRVDQIQEMQEQAVLAQRAVEMNPNDPQRWITLGGFMLRSGYYDRAEEAFSSALTLQPNNALLLNDMANLAMVRGDTLLALQRFQSLLRRDSTFADAWLNIGIIYAMMDRPADARKAWENVLKYKPNDPDAKQYLARLN